MASAESVDALLPQTQCTRCGFSGCRPYAAAISDGQAAINQCPPGGATTIAALAQLLGQASLPLNPAHGVEGQDLVAVIDESLCIGCAKCLPPCPVDAIIGAQRFMHTVLNALCTGCELCVAPCPVDCISMRPRATAAPQDAAPAAGENRRRFEAREARRQDDAARRAAVIAARKNQARSGASPA